MLYIKYARKVCLLFVLKPFKALWHKLSYGHLKSACKILRSVHELILNINKQSPAISRFQPAGP